jgi:hypothetical protein
VDSSTVNPSLFIAVYDPTLGLREAFETGYTRMSLINANGIVAVNIGLQVRQGLDGNSAYDYILGLSSSPTRDLVCDTSSATTYQYPCYVSLFVQIPNFDRTIITTTKAMEWLVSSKLPPIIRGTLTVTPGCRSLGRCIIFLCTICELDRICTGVYTLTMESFVLFMAGFG